MIYDWWNSMFETSALDINDTYVQSLLAEFKVLGESNEKEVTQDSSPRSPSIGDEAL